MARNFMTNTVSNIFGHHNRISLLESIYACQSGEALRKVYPAWAHALETNSTGKKRLPGCATSCSRCSGVKCQQAPVNCNVRLGGQSLPIGGHDEACRIRVHTPARPPEGLSALRQ